MAARKSVWIAATIVVAAIVAAGAFWIFVPKLPAGRFTVCTVNHVCYCVTRALNDDINRDVAVVRADIRRQRDQGKAIGYLGVPLSSVGGAYFKLNAAFAKDMKDKLEARLGPALVWVLDPGDPKYGLPHGATGADYMLVWSEVLEGQMGLGADFDFVYFVGPSDFARYLALGDANILATLDALYDTMVKSDPGLARIKKEDFRAYYGLRASVSYSLGSHDEWNVVASINDQRRDDPDYGIPKQLGIFFDGRAIVPAVYDDPTTDGNAGACRRG
jgi:hypothetical protein